MSNYVYANAPRADILRMVPPDGKIIGSVGCGYAATEAELVRQGREVWGVDVAPQVESVAKSNLTCFDLIKPGDELPWSQGSLDGLILADVIEHLPLAWEALSKWSRCVRPGGWVVISVPNMHNISVVSRFLLTGDWPERDSGIFDRTHLQVMSPKRLHRWCRTAGLEVERTFDSYGGSGGRIVAFRMFNVCTLRLFQSWMSYQIQFLCRVQKPRA
jgi:SAM-dependent methyltransferase